MKEVKPIKINKDILVSDLVSQMSDAGFGARKIGRAVDIIEKMYKSESTVFFGLSGAMVPAGMKQIIIDLINKKKINVLVTTGANLTHDLVEAMGDKHYQCDSWDDSEFHKKGYYRMYNVLMKNKVYEKLEGFFEENWEELKNNNNIRNFLKEVGRLVSDKNSILSACYNNNVPIFCPSLADSGIGLMIWGRIVQNKEIKINAFDDMKEIIDIAWTSKKKGVIYVGGGVPKNFIQQSLQFSSGADYGVQITTDRVESGGSSGAPLEEGKSWGKLKDDAEFVDVFCDATIALPLIFAKFL